MEYAWSFVQSMMLQRLKDGTSGELTLDIAMLDPTWEGVCDFSSTWATTARSHHDRIEAFIRLREADFARRKWKMRLHVYRHAPNWHGFLLDESTLFVSSCRWSGSELLGGENSYELYESETAMGREKIEQFKGWFGYCCRSGHQKT